MKKPLLLLLLHAALLPGVMATVTRQEAMQPDKLANAHLQGHDDDDAPMVYTTPVDYAASAKKQLEMLRAEGKEAILQSEVFQQGKQGDGGDDCPGNCAQRVVDYMNELLRNGVTILNDMATHDTLASAFHVGGHYFDLGPDAGTTKGEYRAFQVWAEEHWDASEPVEHVDVPERWQRFEVKTDAEEAVADL